MTIDFICAVSSRPTSPSAAEASARLASGFVIFQSLARFGQSYVVLPSTVTSMPSTLAAVERHQRLVAEIERRLVERRLRGSRE